jgi:hypothetical protein
MSFEGFWGGFGKGIGFVFGIQEGLCKWVLSDFG